MRVEASISVTGSERERSEGRRQLSTEKLKKREKT
jgi:hypothetical protein